MDNKDQSLSRKAAFPINDYRNFTFRRDVVCVLHTRVIVRASSINDVTVARLVVGHLLTKRVLLLNNLSFVNINFTLIC